MSIFISYAKEDRIPAKTIRDRLEARGWECWIAPDDISSGESWAKAIGEAIRQCKVLVLVFSGSANASSEVEREVLLARRRTIPVLPFVLEEVDLTPEFEYHLGNIQQLHAYQMREDEALKTLEQHVARHVPVEKKTAKSAIPPAVIRRWKESHPKRPTASSWLCGGIFISFAPEDWPAAEKLAWALRRAAITVLFGVALDIEDARSTIQRSRLFIPVISRHAAAAANSLYQLLWSAALTASVGSCQTFILPVVVDDLSPNEWVAPGGADMAHWTRLDPDDIDPDFVRTVDRWYVGGI